MKDVVLFDGVCNLCNGAVDFILQHEAAHQLYFVTLQSEVGLRLTEDCGVNCEEMNTLVLVDGEDCYTQSTAILRIASYLKYPWRLFSIFHLIPQQWRDIFYSYLAKRRYKWFGKRESCRLPRADEKERFLDE